MYEKYYGFKDRPFNLTPDSDFFFPSDKHEEALNRLLLAISERNGFAVITGEIGSGKTTVCRALLNKLDESTKVALVLNTHLSKKELLMTVLDDLEIPYASRSKTDMLAAFNEYLIEQASKEVNVVVIIDEAQNLTPSVLEEVRMLSNLETEKEKLVQIILLGQPELKKKLGTAKLEQFSQRIVFYYHLDGLSRAQAKEYIEHRLKIAGYTGEQLFDEEAIDQIYEYSKGIPRLINLACHNALIGGLVADAKIITGALAREAVAELLHNRFFSRHERLQAKIDDAATTPTTVTKSRPHINRLNVVVKPEELRV